MSAPSTIRLAEAGDCNAIALLLDILNRHEGFDHITDATSLSAALFGRIRHVALSAFVAEIDGQVVGTLLYYPGYDTLSASYGYHLADMVVLEPYRGNGVGRSLMCALAKQTLSEQKAWVSLTVMRRNERARYFYRAVGMTEVAVDFYAMGKVALAQL